MTGSRRVHDQLHEAWLAGVRQGICESIAPYDLRLGRAHDCGVTLHSIDLGLVRIVCGSPGRIEAELRRTPRLIRASDPELCKIDLQVRGQAVIGQEDRQARLRPGAFTFVDLSRPSQLAGDVGGVAAVMFPRSALPLRYRDVKELAGVTFGPREANSALVAALVGQVASRPGDYASGVSGGAIGTAILDLLTAALSVRLDRCDAIAPDTKSRVLLWRIKAFIEAELGSGDLSPAQIAAAHHISLRYLYRLFEPERTTVGAWLRARRLERCRRDLTDPMMGRLPVSAIAARWGLPDATHFTRIFKAKYGLTPTEFRRLCTQGQGLCTPGRDGIEDKPST